MSQQPERQRNGLRTLYNISRALCRAVTFFAPALRNQYRNNPQVIQALELAESVCSILPILEDELAYEGVNADIPTNPIDIPGADADALPAPPVP